MANITRRNEPGIPSRGAGGAGPSTRQWFRDFLGWDPFAEMLPSVGGSDLTFVPSFEVKESKDAYTFVADLPGVRDEDLDISVAGNRLTISGKREAEETKEDERWYAYERSYGSFTRTFTLPDDASPELVDAKLDKGVLWIRISKAAEARPKKIELGAKSNKPKA